MESSPKEEGFSEEGPVGKCCYDCKTTKTPLWRSGPSGPKSLCNACGIRHRKKQVSPDTPPDEGSAKIDEKKTSSPETPPDEGSAEIDEEKASPPDTGRAENDAKKSKIGRKKKKKKKKKKGVKLKNGLKVNMLGLKRITSPRQWGEVERAALLLMALSCGAVFA